MTKSDKRQIDIPKLISNYLQRLPRLWRMCAKCFGIRGFSTSNLQYRRTLQIQVNQKSKTRNYKYVFDGQTFQTLTRQRGIGMYSANFLAAICKKYSQHAFGIILTNIVDQKEISNAITTLQELELENLDVIVIDVFDKAEKVSFKTAQQNLHNKLEEIGCSLVLCLSTFENPKQVIPVPKSSEYKRVGILYDLIPRILPELLLFSKENKQRYAWLLQNLQGFDLLLSISGESKKSWIDCNLSKIPIEVIGGGSRFQSNIQTHPFSFDMRFGILAVGAEQKHKNLDLLLAAYLMLDEKLQQTHNLILVGIRSKGEKKRLMKLANQAHGAVIIPDYLDDRELQDLYLNSRILVMPSLIEGLSLPILEAWEFGLLAIGSRGTVAEELIQDTELLFDPKSAEDLRRLLQKYMVSESAWNEGILSSGFKAKKLTWENAAFKAINAIEKMNA
jgi:glycosyltransferase involved in cell wall biosynthesis